MRLWWAGALLAGCCFPSASQVAILQIQVVEGEATVHTPGSRNGHALTVVVTDETGKPAAGAVVTFKLPDDGPGGTFANGLRSEVVTADARGRASIRGLHVNRIPGRFQIRITTSLEQARAGIVSFQYVAGLNEGAATAADSKAKPRSRWPWIALVVGAAAAGGIAAGAGGGGGHSGTTVAALPQLPSTPSLSIGGPTISVGRP